MHRFTFHLALITLIVALAGGATTTFAQEPPEPSTAEPENPFSLDPQDFGSEEGILDLEELLAPYRTDVPAEEPEDLPEQLPEEPRPATETEQPSPAPTPLLTEDHVAAAAERFEEEGRAPVVGLPTGKLYPFGEAIPEIVCLPYRACDLELEAGETIDGLVLGDPQDWSSEFLFEGSDEALIPHVVLKPAGFDLATNGVVVTSKRTYHFELRSPAKGQTEPTEYHHHVSWWYPEDWVRRARAEQAATAQESLPPASPLERPLNLAALNFHYRLELPSRRKRRLPWQPVTVFDDGERTFLRLPPEARRGDLPVLLGQLEGGETFPLESRLARDWLIVPEVTRRLQLVVGTGKARRSLTLVNREAAP